MFVMLMLLAVIVMAVICALIGDDCVDCTGKCNCGFSAYDEDEETF